MKKGHGKNVLKQTLDELIKDRIQHFTDEEFFIKTLSSLSRT